MTILITGASGYIGRHFLRSLTPGNEEWVLLLRDRVKLLPLLEQLPINIKIIELSDPDWKEQVRVCNPELVLHLASFLSSADDEHTIDQLLDANLRFGTHLLDALKGTSVQLIINTGTFAEYTGKEQKQLWPAYLYAATKTAFRPILTYYQRLIGFRLVHVIPYTVYGGRADSKKLMDYLFESLGQDISVDMSPGEQVLDFIHIDDVVCFFRNLIDQQEKIELPVTEFHLGTGTGTTARQLCGIIEEVSVKKAAINWGGRPYRPLDTLYAVAPQGELADLIQWKATISLREGVKTEYSKYYKSGI